MFRRLGISPWLAIFYALPGAGYVFVWVLALVRWPRLDAPARIADEF